MQMRNHDFVSLESAHQIQEYRRPEIETILIYISDNQYVEMTVQVQQFLIIKNHILQYSKVRYII